MVLEISLFYWELWVSIYHTSKVLVNLPPESSFFFNTITQLKQSLPRLQSKY